MQEPTPTGSSLPGYLERFDYRITVPSEDWQPAPPQILATAGADRMLMDRFSKVAVSIHAGGPVKDLSRPEEFAQQYAAFAASQGYKVAACDPITIAGRADLKGLRVLQDDKVLFMAMTNQFDSFWVMSVTGRSDQEAPASAAFEAMASSVQFGPAK
jgi:hypothetical protein